MAKISAVYSGDFVTADQLKGRRVTAQIVQAAVEELGQDKQPKVVLRLCSADGKPWGKRLVCNKTNSMLLAATFGDDTDDWHGRSITVWSEPVQFQGRVVQGIRVVGLGNSAAPPPAAEPWAEHAPAHSDLDDEIPF